MLVLINLNDYLGGGETLMVRMASYLQKGSRPFCLVCSEKSYIYNDLVKKNVSNIITIENDKADFYYKDKNEREAIITELKGKLPEADYYSFITFCMRDLYAITQLVKTVKDAKTCHLVLHYQDNLFVCQSLFDKLYKKFFHKERYSRKKQIEFNNGLFNRLCSSEAVIPMSDLMVNFWNKKFEIKLKSDNVVALPAYDFPKERPAILHNNHKIIFIGRIVDFKIPGLCVMLNFINHHPEYTLTVVGNGDMKFINDYINKNNIDRSRLFFIGELDYSELGNVIKQHSIGYAMGTSLIEICRYGLPTIMALSTPKHRLFKRDICGGLYANCIRGNVGDNLFAGENEDDQPLLEDVMAELESHYDESAINCYEYVKCEYNLTKNISRYLEIIDNARLTDFADIQIPEASIFRKFAYKFF